MSCLDEDTDLGSSVCSLDLYGTAMRLDQFERAIQTQIYYYKHREVDGECYRSDEMGLLEVHCVEYVPALPIDVDSRPFSAPFEERIEACLVPRTIARVRR